MDIRWKWPKEIPRSNWEKYAKATEEKKEEKSKLRFEI